MRLVQDDGDARESARPLAEGPGVHPVGPPVGEKGRRHDDLSVEVGEATTPNLDQDQIDALFQPKAVAR